MNMKFTRLLVGVSLSALAFWTQAQDARPIRLIVPFAPGGSTDVLARIISPGLSRALGQTVIIENRPGAGGSTGTLEMLRAPADGFTLAMSTASTVAANPAINPKLAYGPADVAPIAIIAATPTVIAINPKFPAKDFASFVAELQRNPSRYSYSSSGVGGISHLQMETFKSRTKTFITHIPYRGAAQALTDTISGQVQIVMDALPSALPFIMSEKLRPIVVSAPSRLPNLPDVPTFAEVGLEQMNRMSAFGIIGSKSMSPDVIRKVNAAVRTALEDPVVRQRIIESGAIPVGGTPEQYASEINAEFNQLKRVVIERKLTLD